MNLGLTKEEAAYLLTLIQFDILDAGGIQELKSEPGMKYIDVECLMRQLKIITMIGDSAKEKE